jgi:hypothetical protein
MTEPWAQWRPVFASTPVPGAPGHGWHATCNIHSVCAASVADMDADAIKKTLDNSLS